MTRPSRALSAGAILLSVAVVGGSGPGLSPLVSFHGALDDGLSHAQSAVLVGAGDIADCSSDADERTARLLDGIPGVVFTAGDNAYPEGSHRYYRRCYAPTWGRHKHRTKPAPGNHDYRANGGRDYFEYFGSAAGPPGAGFYSYQHGAWRIIVLNSSRDMRRGSTQEKWLRAELEARRSLCTLAINHIPRFSSGLHGSNRKVEPLWDALYEAGAEVVISGHDHLYERFSRQTPDGRRDTRGGIRQFVVGTGGTRLYGVLSRARHSEVVNTRTHGVLKLTLEADGYRWEFVPTSPTGFRDSGRERCH